MDKSMMYFLGFLLFVTVIGWAGISFYDAYQSVEVDPNLSSVERPIEPVFPIETLDDVRNRIDELPVSPEVLREVEEGAVFETEDVESDPVQDEINVDDTEADESSEEGEVNDSDSNEVADPIDESDTDSNDGAEGLF